MVAVLLSHVVRGSRRVDGSGGDGGRDVYFRDYSGDLHVYELKSFTGRMSSGRRKQVKRSLERAARHEPATWRLVVPIDPTPSEDDWFAELGETVDFGLTWHGLTWLDAEMAKRPSIARYFLEGTSDEVLRLLKDLREEQAAITGGALEVAARASKLVGKLNELDCYFEYGVSVGLSAGVSLPTRGLLMSVQFGNSRIDVSPAYPGAEVDRPILVDIDMDLQSIDPGQRGRLQAVFDHGARDAIDIPVKSFSLDAPGGLGGEFDRGLVKLVADVEVLAEPVEVALEILEPHGTVASIVSVYFDDRTHGHHGVTLTGQDATHCLRVRMVVDFRESALKCEFELDAPDHAVPATLLPATRWITALQPGRELAIRLGHAPTSPSIVVLEESVVPEHAFADIEHMATIQERSGVYFPYPWDLSEVEREATWEAATLLRGDEISFSWDNFSMTLDDDGPSDRLRSLLADLENGKTAHGLALSAVTELNLRNHKIHLGEVVTRFFDVGGYELSDGSLQEGTVLTLTPGDDRRGVKSIRS